MVHVVKLADALLRIFSEPSELSSKGLTEMAMALHYVRRNFPADMTAGVDAAEAAVFARLHSEPYLGLVTNGFLHQQCLAPYIFLRSAERRSAFYESLLADLAETDRSVRECTPYRRMERSFLLYKAGRGRMDELRGAAILYDARHAYALDRDLSYAFTHAIFYCTDFADLPLSDPFVKGVTMLLAAQSHARHDIDLFMECCICLLAHELSGPELQGMLNLVAALSARAARMFEARRLSEEYHPLFVHDILRGLVLRHHGIDIAERRAGTEAGPFGQLAEIAQALGGKDAGLIHAALRRYEDIWGKQPWLEDMVCGRLELLGSLARRGVLFEREFAVMNRRNDVVYGEYGANAAGIIAELQARAPAPQRHRRGGL